MNVFEVASNSTVDRQLFSTTQQLETDNVDGNVPTDVPTDKLDSTRVNPDTTYCLPNETTTQILSLSAHVSDSDNESDVNTQADLFPEQDVVDVVETETHDQ